MTCSSKILIMGSLLLEKKQRYKLNFLNTLVTSNVLHSSKSEIDVYLEEECESDIRYFDVLACCKSKQEHYHAMSVMARNFLAIPLSIVSSKSTFCCSERILRDIEAS